MSAPDRSAATIPVPDYIYASDGGDWRFYISGHDPENVLIIDEAENLVWEPLWMRPIQTSHLDEMERPEDAETVTRGKDGRFRPTCCWLECDETHPAALPWLGVRYA